MDSGRCGSLIGMMVDISEGLMREDQNHCYTADVRINMTVL